MKGETLMRKRHLEILGYRVVQVRERLSTAIWFCESLALTLIANVNKMVRSLLSLFSFYRSLTLNGTQWSFLHTKLGTNI